MEMVEFTVLHVGEKLTALLACLEKEKGMRVTKDTPGDLEAGGIVTIDGDRSRVFERLTSCDRKWEDCLRPR